MKLFSVSPSDSLTFDLSPNTSKTENLQITNISSKPIAFKLRTTASKAYLVKPNQGYLSPSVSTTISITIQASEIQPESKHKFMVLATESVNCDDFALWNNIPKEKIEDVKIEVILSTGKNQVNQEVRRVSIYTDSKNSIVNESNTEEILATIKKQEAEKNLLEAKLNQITGELRIKELKPPKGQAVKFKRNTLIFFAVAGLIFGHMYS